MPKYRLMTPGPVAVPERVREAMGRTLIHHRAPAFLPILDEVRENLKKVFQTEQDVLLLAGTTTVWSGGAIGVISRVPTELGR